MKNESVRKSSEKSKNVPGEKSKMVKRTICQKKTITSTIIAMNFVQEQLINISSLVSRVNVEFLQRNRNGKKNGSAKK